MKIRILELSKDDFFLVDETNKPVVVARANSVNGVIESVGKLTGNEIVIEKFPTDYLFKITSDFRMTSK